MARVLNQRQRASFSAHRKRQKQRKNERQIAERMAIDPSYDHGAVQAERRMFKRCKQLRRWCNDLMERRDPRRPRSSKDIDSFIKLTKIRTDGELMEQLNLDTVSSGVKDLFARVFRERATALEMKGEKDPDGEVEDWWGTGSEMKEAGGVVPGKGGEAVSNEEQGESEGGEDEGGEDGGDGMDIEDDEEAKKFEHRLPIRTKGMAS